MSIRKGRSTKIALGLITMVAAAAGTIGLLGKHRRREIVEASIPPTPSLETAAPELRRRVFDAVENARSGRDPVSSLVELSQMYHANGYLAEATECYAGLLRLDPQNPKWADLQAAIFGGVGRLDEAVALLRFVVAKAPDQIAARVRLGDALVKLNRLDQGAETYRGVLARDPRNVYGLLGLARCDEASERWQEAEENLQKALQCEPNFGVAWARLATVAERLDQPDLERLALTHSKKNSRFHDISDPWLDGLMEDCYDTYKLRVASAVEHEARHDEWAIHLLERALRIAPDDAPAHRELGRILLYQRNFDGSRLHLEKRQRWRPTILRIGFAWVCWPTRSATLRRRRGPRWPDFRTIPLPPDCDCNAGGNSWRWDNPPRLSPNSRKRGDCDQTRPKRWLK